MARSQPDRFLAVWQDMPKGTPATHALRKVGVEGDTAKVRNKLRDWRFKVPGFDEAHRALAEYHAIQLPAEEIEKRINRYIEILNEQLDTDGHLNRQKAARAAGISMSTIAQKLDRNKERQYDPGFEARYRGVLDRVNASAEDILDRCATTPAKELAEAGHDFRHARFVLEHQKLQPRYQNRFQDMRALEIEQRGTVNVHVHHHQLAEAANGIADRFLQDPSMKVIEVKPREVKELEGER